MEFDDKSFAISLNVKTATKSPTPVAMFLAFSARVTTAIKTVSDICTAFSISSELGSKKQDRNNWYKRA